MSPPWLILSTPLLRLACLKHTQLPSSCLYTSMALTLICIFWACYFLSFRSLIKCDLLDEAFANISVYDSNPSLTLEPVSFFSHNIYHNKYTCIHLPTYRDKFILYPFPRSVSYLKRNTVSILIVFQMSKPRIRKKNRNNVEDS